MRRRRLIDVCAVIALCSLPAALTASSSDAAAPVYVATGGAGDNLKQKPHRIIVGEHHLLRRIRWNSWGGRRAHGNGTSLEDDCTPTCADGSTVRSKVRIVLSRKRDCRGRNAYTSARLTLRYPDGTTYRGSWTPGCR